MFQAEIPAGTCKYKENEKGELGSFLAVWEKEKLGLMSCVLINE